MILIPREGMLNILQLLLTRQLTPYPSVTYHWFVNDYTPAYGDTLSSYVEASGLLIPSLSVDDVDWSLTAPADTATAEAAEAIISVTSAVTIYGYYVTNPAGTELLWAERFEGGPFTYGVLGGTLAFTPRFQITSPID